MIFGKRVYILTLLFVFVASGVFWVYLRFSFGEGGCSSEIVWVDENNIGKSDAPYRSQVYEKGFLVFNYLSRNISYYGEGGYMSEIDILPDKNSEVNISNVEVRYLFGGSELKPVGIHLEVYDKNGQSVIEKNALLEEVSDILIGGGKRARITYVYDFDANKNYFNKGVVEFIFEYTRNGYYGVVKHKRNIVRATLRYNCLWGSGKTLWE